MPYSAPATPAMTTPFATNGATGYSMTVSPFATNGATVME